MWLLLLMMRWMKDRRALSTSGRSLAKYLGKDAECDDINVHDVFAGASAAHLHNLVRNMFSEHKECNAA
jgi:hypothetical protein